MWIAGYIGYNPTDSQESNQSKTSVLYGRFASVRTEAMDDQLFLSAARK